MKLDFNRKYNTIAVYAVLVVAVSALVVCAIVNFNAIRSHMGTVAALLTPFIVGFVIAYIINPILNGVERRVLRPLLGGRLSAKAIRVVSVVITYIVALIILTVFFRIVIPQIVSSITSIALQIPSWLNSAQIFINRLIEEYDLANLQLSQSTISEITKAVGQVVNKLSAMLTGAIPQVLQGAMSVTNGVLDFIIGVIISVYLLLSKERFFAQIKKLLTALIPQNAVNKIVDITHQSHEIFSGFISGKLLDSLIIGILCFLGMWLFGMPYATLISVIVGVTNIIPYFGPFIGAIPSALILLIVDPMTALWFCIFVLLLQQLDGNVIGPKILGQSTGLSAFWVIFSITVFGSLLGLVGMFIGVPLFAVIYSLVRQFAEWRLAAKGLPTETVSYASDKHLLLEERKGKKRREKRSGGGKRPKG